MADVKWIKIVTDIFDDEKMLLIESLPSADSLIVIWFKLLCLAGKNNNNGVFLLNDRIAYTDEMLASIFRRDVNTVRLALRTFEEYGMIEVIEGVITIPNWEKHQTLDAYEKKKERDRLYQARRREKQKAIVDKSSDKSFDIHADYSSDVVVTDIDIEKDKEKDIDKDINILSNTNVLDCPKKSDENKQKYVFEYETRLWNELETLGIAAIRGVSPNSERASLLKARFKQYGQDSFKDIVRQIRDSDFLQGKHSGNPWQVTFDWVIKPRNYPKVLEGNYKNKNNSKYTGSAFDYIDIGE